MSPAVGSSLAPGSWARLFCGPEGCGVGLERESGAGGPAVEHMERPIGNAPWIITGPEFAALARRKREATSTPPFSFVVVLWGGAFRRLFLRLCLPSLLSPGNIPALGREQRGQFIICTTSEDRAAIEADSAFRRLAEEIEPRFVLFEKPKSGDDKYALMSAGHLAAATAIHARRGIGIFLCPDAIVSNGAISALERLSLAGARAVLAPPLRYCSEGLIPVLEASGRFSGQHPAGISARELMALALPQLHPEDRRFDWHSRFFSYEPVCCFWRVPGDGGMILHSHSWAPVLMDYSALDRHDTHTLETWTMDGDYVFRNFGIDRRIAVIADSDILAYVSFTTTDQHSTPLVRNFTKGTSLRAMAYHPKMDPLRQRLFRIPIRVHTQDFTPAWDEQEKMAADILKRNLHPPTLLGIKWVQIARTGLRGLPAHLQGWLRCRLGMRSR
jgi:hypothetical protein